MSDAPTSITIRLNGEAHGLACPGGGVTVADLIASLDLGQARVAVEVNGEVVGRQRHGETRLVEGDVVEVVSFVGGG